MLCSSCGHENPDDAVFCEQCANDILPTCPSCQKQNTPGSRFCRFCRTPLEAETPSAQPMDLPKQPAEETPKHQTPTSFSDGRYVVEKFLGEGGKKMVYLAHDELLDRDVAFALIKTEGLDETSRTRISREAQAMGRLGSHPHIVTVFDLGDHEGQPYMVTELMGGGDVESIIEDAPDHKLPLEQVIHIGLETCRGLEFAHSKGIVHRDLKPGNIWLTEDGTAKIGDFGLAVATDRSRLTQEGMMVGTVSYMPPEQAMGGDVTPKADLYSLGAMLYEMVCGRPPFLGDDSVAIIGQHINTPPVAPTWHRSDCPRPLEALILRLLSKDPNERPSSASDVITALDAVDLTSNAGMSISADSHDDQGQNILDSLAGDVFVGRHQEMDQLKAALEDALSGRGRMVTLVGEPGIGKTRTATELVTYANLRGAQVLWGRCYEEQGVPSYWPWVQAIRTYVRDSDADTLRSEMGAGAADIAEIVSDVKTRLPDLEPPTQLESPEQARFRLFDSITSFLKTASQRQPIMLVLDDLHWSDQPSLMLLQFIARELTGSRLLVVGTYRDVELNRQHPLAETLGELTRERLFERVLLRGLTLNDVSRFIELASGITPPQSLSRAVHTQTEGNPLFVTEVVRLLVQEGELTAQNVRERDSWEIRVPEGVREVLGRRLNRLSQRCNETLTTASVIGREFRLDQLDLLIDDLTSDMLLDVLEEALTARLIEELPTSVGLYQFTHALIQETLNGELSLTRKVRLHARIAEMLEQLHAENVEAYAAEIAHHFVQAEAMLGSDKMVHYSLIAGERALAVQGYEEAQIHFRRVLASREGQETDAVIAQALLGLARAEAPTVDRHLAQATWELFERAFNYYMEVGESTQAITIAQTPLGITASVKGRADVALRALELVREDSLDAGHLWSQHGYSLWFENKDYEGSQEALSRAIEIARQSGDEVLEARSLTDSCYVDTFYGVFRGLLEKVSRAVELAHRVNDLQTEVRARSALSGALIRHGRLEQQPGNTAAFMEIAEKLRDGQWLMVGSLHQGNAAHLQGDWQAAREHYEKGLEITQWAPILHSAAINHFEVGSLDEGDACMVKLKEQAEREPSGGTYTNFLIGTLILRCQITGEQSFSRISDPLDSKLIRVLAEADWDPEGVWKSLHATHNSDIEAATRCYAALQANSGLMSPRMGVCFDRLLGLLALTISKPEAATDHFEDAIAFCRKSSYRPELAWSLHDYADMLLERDGDGDKAKATSLLDESLQISSDLDMRPLMERVLSRREILKA